MFIERSFCEDSENDAHTRKKEGEKHSESDRLRAKEYRQEYAYGADHGKKHDRGEAQEVFCRA